ncbi:uncharacterized protein LOC133829639 [Humulus lupulus]|uniref:uncharacterized protein LOC133829639 n=1 Tax=Humulus lupulus TaxID=3486 RepID=UPI002B403518|nr:uncharacterized protein LOC133829639 [Humulus lupulus]
MLTGKNFANWKSNINIVLNGDNGNFMMTDECPTIPNTAASTTTKEDYECWQAVNNKTMVYMLASMFDMLKNKLENVAIAFEIMEQLQEIFGKKYMQAHFDATKKYDNDRMALRMHVRDHFIKMTNYFQ